MIKINKTLYDFLFQKRYINSKFLRFQSILLILIFHPWQTATAAEFPWFKVNDYYEGFVEFNDGESTIRKIYVLPVLGTPGTAFFHDKPWVFGETSYDNGIDLVDNGDAFLNFKIITNNDCLPKDFKEKVLSYISGNGFNTSKYKTLNIDQYIVQFIKPQNIKVALSIDRKEFASKIYSGILGANYRDKFQIPEKYINEIRKGNYDLQISYDFPYQTFSSLTINIDEKMLTNIKIETYRQLFQQSSSVTNGFFFIKWRENTQRTIESNRVSMNATNENTSRIEIVSRDAKPEMEERINTMLGFATITKNQLIAQHTASMNYALNSNNMQLGDLHRKYIDAVKSDDLPSAFDVAKSAAALASGDVLSFIASGIAFSEAHSNTFSNFIGVKNIAIQSNASSTYNELSIATSKALYNSMGFKPESMKTAFDFAFNQRNSTIEGLGTSYITSIMWSTAFLNSVKNNDTISLKYLIKYFIPIAKRNAVTIDQGNSALHIAVAKENLNLIRLLLDFGVNSKLKNRYGETAEDIAIKKNRVDIVQLLNQNSSRSGKIEIEYSMPKGYKIQSISYYPLYLNNPNGTTDMMNNLNINSNKFSIEYLSGLYGIGVMITYINSFGNKEVCYAPSVYKISQNMTINYREELIKQNNGTLTLKNFIDVISLTKPFYEYD